MVNLNQKFLNTFKINCKNHNKEKIISKQLLRNPDLEDILVHLSFLSLAIKNVINDKKIFKNISEVKIYSTEHNIDFNINLSECKKACELFKTLFAPDV